MNRLDRVAISAALEAILSLCVINTTIVAPTDKERLKVAELQSAVVTLLENWKGTE